MYRILLSLLLLCALTPAGAQNKPIEIEQWQVPWANTQPRDPALANDGRIWFVGQAGNYAAVFNPKTAQFKRYELPDGAGPHTVYITRNQQIWYAGNTSRHLGRIDAESGKVMQVTMPADELADPHTLVEDSKGRLWFTAQWANQIGRYDRHSGKIAYVDVPTNNARPYGIAIDTQDIVWVVLMGTNKLARITPNMELTEIALPREDARPRRIAITKRGIWYVDYAGGYLGVYNPATGKFKEWLSAAGKQSAPYAMAADDQGRIWFVQTYAEPNRFVGFDPKSEKFFSSTATPGVTGSVRHMVYDAKRKSIWFATDSNYLMRAKLAN